MTGLGRARRAAGGGLLVVLAVAALAGSIAWLAWPGAWTPLGATGGIALAALAWMRPALSVAALLVLAPVCGNRPTTGTFLFFLTLTAWAVPPWLIRLATRDRARLLDVAGTPIGLALCAYAGVSLASLSSLPLYAPAAIVGAETAGEALARLPAALATADVLAPIYSVLTVVLTLQAVAAALTIAVAMRADAEGPPPAGVDAVALVAGALLAGLALTLAAGALDRLAVLDLRHLRDIDPVSYRFGGVRLQSTFGHAGWLAQYICFATPAVLACWLWPPGDAAPPSKAWRIGRPVAAATLLGAALVAIVFSYQRGGWLTWAVVGAMTAALLVRLSLADRRAGASLRGGRMLVVGAAALVVALGAGLLVVRVAGGAAAMERFAARARTITQVSDRQHHVLAGLRLGAQLPVLGGGSESFARRYREEYLLAGGAYYARGHSPVLDLYGSAHNVFAQTFAGKGAAGLVALLLIVAGAATVIGRRLRDPATAPRAWITAAIAAGMLTAFVLYGQVQEVFYIPALQLTMFAGFGLALGLDASGTRGRAPGRLGWIAVVLLATLAAHLVHAYVAPGRLAEGYRDHLISQAGARLSPPVLGDDGVHFQWTGARAVVTVPRQATELSFEVRRGSPEPRALEIRFDGRLADTVHLGTDGWRRMVYPLQKMRVLPRRLELSVTPIARPEGSAEHGVAVRRIRWGDR